MIKIDQEFKQLIPALQPEEYEELKKSILAEGCRDAIVTWNGIIVDGHNRFEICTNWQVEYRTVEKEFASREDAKIWMITNQFGRRNITAYQRSLLALALEPLVSVKAKERQKGGQGGILLSQNSDKASETIDTKKELAKLANVSHDTIAKVKKIEAQATPEVKAKLSSGEVSINQVYTEIKNEEKKQERKAMIDETKKKIEAGEIEKPTGLFDVLVIDPPWSYGREYDPETSRVANPYPEMSQEQLLKLEIPSKPDSVMFLWTTHAFIWDAKELLDKWGYTYKATLVWNKESIGMGAWFRMQCEFCLVGIKGKPFFQNTTHRDIITERRREHSRKPDSFYAMVEDITAGRRLDFFSREKRDGWYTFGAEDGKLE